MPESNPLDKYTTLQLIAELARRLQPPPLETMPLAELQAELERRTTPRRPIQIYTPGEEGIPEPEPSNAVPTPNRPPNSQE